MTETGLNNEKGQHEIERYKECVRYLVAENRAMQTKISQLASDLASSSDEMKKLVLQSTEDRIRIVEHQQLLMEENEQLREQLAKFEKNVSQK
ncbi:hypothetical protein RFI_13041 [Reticulomyxa filosa]|uniref:Uncharacterized protein n=1 Tax=Reticulomyxa filosa TaxID=46433 RepID=X6NFJ7_RETFI|nr:hypothetical protein RFI_13041 [Reticulomyxa filosa]|eukprot:ETO24117.1 hypothetical protein RFI_13041 [Reticulomyxa filosa]